MLKVLTLLLPVLRCAPVKALQADNESSTLVQISQVFLGQTVKGKEWKKDQFAQLPGFGAAKGKYERSEVERILYHMVLRQYLREVVSALWLRHLVWWCHVWCSFPFQYGRDTHRTSCLLNLPQDKSNAKGFTTTFLAAGVHADRLQRGEQVCLVIKTRYKARAVSDAPSTASAGKKKTPKAPKEPKAPGKKAKAPTKKKKVASTYDDVEVLSDDFDDVVEVIRTTAQYPLIPVTHTAGRCGSTWSATSSWHVLELCAWIVLMSEWLAGLALDRIPESHVEALAQLLKDWRASVCDNFNVMPYHILPTSGIAAIANAVPVTNAELSGIDGVGRIRVKKYGDAIIEIVKSYLSKVTNSPLYRLLVVCALAAPSRWLLGSHFDDVLAQLDAVASCSLCERGDRRSGRVVERDRDHRAVQRVAVFQSAACSSRSNSSSGA